MSYPIASAYATDDAPVETPGYILHPVDKNKLGEHAKLNEFYKKRSSLYIGAFGTLWQIDPDVSPKLIFVGYAPGLGVANTSTPEARNDYNTHTNIHCTRCNRIYGDATALAEHLRSNPECYPFWQECRVVKEEHELPCGHHTRSILSHLQKRGNEVCMDMALEANRKATAEHFRRARASL